jgi:hypothetical protein
MAPLRRGLTDYDARAYKYVERQAVNFHGKFARNGLMHRNRRRMGHRAEEMR